MFPDNESLSESSIILKYALGTIRERDCVYDVYVVDTAFNVILVPLFPEATLCRNSMS